MSWIYVCPFCNERLNPNKTLILLAEHDSRRMLVGFHPEPGNYEIYFPADAGLEEGQSWDFFCPVCRSDLKTDEDEKMCAVTMLEPDLSRRVLFSRVAGEHATYVIYDRELEHRYGKDAEGYGYRQVPIRRDGDTLQNGERDGDDDDDGTRDDDRGLNVAGPE